MNSNVKKLLDLRERKGRILQMGGSKSVEKQHERSKLTARERIDLLFDAGTFMEVDALVKHRCTLFGMEGKELPADAVVTGSGKINGNNAFVAAEDFTVMAGTFGEMHGKKICKVIDAAAKCGSPFIQIIDSGGARLQEGQDSSEIYAQLFRRHTLYSGVIPQITLLLGSCGGGAAYGPALSDFIIMVDGISRMYMGGPAFVKTMLGENKTEEELGGAKLHSEITGLCDFVAKDDREAIGIVKELLSLLPSNNREKPPIVKTEDDPGRLNKGIIDILPEDSRVPFDMYRIIREIVDNGYFLEYKARFAKNMITCFARLNGQPVGILANNSMVMGGVIDVGAANKHARFVRICDAYNIPIIHIQDSPAVMIGQNEEKRGIIKHGSKMLHAVTEASVPKVTLVIRHSYAGAQLCMCNVPLGADFVFAWPTAEITLVGPETAASILFAKEIAGAENPKEVEEKRIKEYRDVWVNPYMAAERGYIDDVIEPESTRAVLINALNLLKDKVDEKPWKKHGIIQL
ncbi:MAG: methylmalonyl-CoA carboxyltransferase [Deltaproteobacteria bacterium CG12_big_fil_rev_8_21_14_0_65_43_10]|nr:MAG: methylmalonyl-CoA carboxyltransferase [Deltaproteobacteria bacterium CG2_30_43_15]PIQ45801.1 MAG: methylmalonyl-CoA carboxyltransferase [Deltaproteobacteria bacterium CG12_big_fil_rev_8_21_14_0_65_43_10]PIU84822.1 MAG: methylmalonyl-CoA carboxyltransferase [Deltaproteobacteria bacterium CG06_land_8_20_14_3_00_44_19]PIX26325.1 MAG: methylmalonyl-CoA carboxyltransferase [Deltaproteobacteria bacterium CG_4_8_14_3_um_filter_43_13]PJB39796.1 MAG: methylmalonyl-CoA carboxyltransferase [Deltap